METVKTFAFVLLSFSEVVDLVSCVDLGIEMSGKFFHCLFVIFVFAGVFMHVENLVDFGTAVM